MSDFSLSQLIGGDSTDLGSTPDTGDDSYNYYTTGNDIGNLSSDTGLSFINNSEQPSDLSTLLFGVQPLSPSQSLTPNSANEASPNLFSQLFSNAGTALSSPASANQSSLGQLFGNLASRLIQPLAQGSSSNPNTANLNTTTSANAITALLSNPIVLIGGIVVLVLLFRK